MRRCEVCLVDKFNIFLLITYSNSRRKSPDNAMPSSDMVEKSFGRNGHQTDIEAVLERENEPIKSRSCDAWTTHYCNAPNGANSTTLLEAERTTEAMIWFYNNSSRRSLNHSERRILQCSALRFLNQTQLQQVFQTFAIKDFQSMNLDEFKRNYTPRISNCV